jgi:uncharacterized protein
LPRPAPANNAAESRRKPCLVAVMARIDSLNEASSFRLPEKKKTERKKEIRKGSFRSLVEEARESGFLREDFDDGQKKRTLEELLDGVFQSGEALKSAPNVDRIKEYRQNVRAFLDFIVHRMFSLEETTSGGNILRRKRFTLIKVIDGRLEDLALSILRSQREQMDILGKVDEINGLLVDLMS